ncbi:MAG: FtsQ-type POTRA domain-containing protein [Clostridiaceae bacterium]|nr:FtsQ-type POTRA domain-containing protein [Clostridiaceae bacterium]
METKRELRNERKVFIRKVRRTITLVFFVVVFLLWNTYYLLQSDFLNLEEINVKQNTELAEEEIIEASRLITNRNILQYNLSEIEDNLKTHPYIKDAQVTRKLPRTITITVAEREKYAIIPYMGSYIYIDQDKVVLEAYSGGLIEGLPLVTAVEFNSFKVGEKIDIANYHLLDKVMELIQVAKEMEIIEMISEINMGDENNIKLMTFDGVEVLLGQTVDPIYSMVALKEILINLYARDMKNVVVDMRYEGQISVGTRNQWEENQ